MSTRKSPNRDTFYAVTRGIDGSYLESETIETSLKTIEIHHQLQKPYGKWSIDTKQGYTYSKTSNGLDCFARCLIRWSFIKYSSCQAPIN